MQDIQDIKNYIKRLVVNVPASFIDEFMSFYTLNTSQNDFVIDTTSIAKWLQVSKISIYQSLREHYLQNIDYIVKTIPKPPNQKYGNNRKAYLVTPDCFKQLCMMSRSKNATLVRKYFIDVENIMIRYRKDIVNALQTRLATLEKNQKPKVKISPGGLYMIRTPDNQTVYKLGRGQDILARLEKYKTGLADESMDVIYHIEIDDIVAAETCVKGIMQEYRYRKYKEVYQADPKMIKEVMEKCKEACDVKTHYKRNRPSKQTGGYFIVIRK